MTGCGAADLNVRRLTMPTETLTAVCNRQVIDVLIPAGTALAGVLITLIVQGIVEHFRRKHESRIGSRVPLTSACESLTELLEQQMAAITNLEALLGAGQNVATNANLEVLVEKSYRKKLWAVIDDQHCVQPINRYALTTDALVRKLIQGETGDAVLEDVWTARNHLGRALKNVTKHIAEIWELGPVREDEE